MTWVNEFHFIYAVPKVIEYLVRQGSLEDTSWRHDPTPSFLARLKSGVSLKLWIEHPNPVCRKRWEERFIITLVKDPSDVDGETVLKTEDLNHFLYQTVGILRRQGKKKPRIHLRPRYIMAAFSVWWGPVEGMKLPPGAMWTPPAEPSPIPIPDPVDVES